MAAPPDTAAEASEPKSVGQRPLRIGLWELGGTPVERELREELLDAELSVICGGSNPLEVHAVDCLVADCSGPDTAAATVYETIRDSYPTTPLVVITRGLNDAQREEIADAEHTAHVPRTDTGIPVPLVIARCKRLANRPLAETDTAPEPEELSPTVTQTVSLWLLWGVAVLTYGVGDFVTTIIAVYFVEGLGESNPLVVLLLNQFGIRGLFALKIVVFVIAVGINLGFRKRGDRLGYYGPPVFVALLGTLLTVSNLLAINSA